MKSIFFTFSMLLLSQFGRAQDTAVIKQIDRMVALLAEKAHAEKYKLVEGHVMNSKNEENAVRFHQDGGNVEIIKVQDPAKKSHELYYLDKGNLIYYATFTSGNLNVPVQAVYFNGSSAWRKETGGFKEVGAQFYKEQVKMYLLMFKDELSNNK